MKTIIELVISHHQLASRWPVDPTLVSPPRGGPPRCLTANHFPQSGVRYPAVFLVVARHVTRYNQNSVKRVNRLGQKACPNPARIAQIGAADA